MNPLDKLDIEVILQKLEDNALNGQMRTDDDLAEARALLDQVRREIAALKKIAGLRSGFERSEVKCICPFGTLLGDCPEHGHLVPP